MDKKKSNLVIDTDVLINFFDKNKKSHQLAKNAFDDFTNKNIEPSVSIITSIELIQGNKTNSDKQRILKQLEPFDTIFLSDRICSEARDLIITYSSSHGLLMGDALIAATALYLDFQLFTFNKKDFRFIKNLRLYEP